MQKFISELKNLDKNIFKIMKIGLIFCFFIAIISIIFLITYIFWDLNFSYHFGLALMQSTIIFSVEFIICGIVVDFIQKQKI